MKKLLTLLMVLNVLHGVAHAKCINKKHRKVLVKSQGGQQVQTQEYNCAVRASEAKNFDEGYCKNCGCHTTDHDNT